MTTRDWHAWHEAYEDPRSPLVRRLGMVQGQIRAALDAAPPGPLRAVSLCAGQGRDLIGVLVSHPRRADVTARLVELDPRNTEVAHRLAAEAGLSNVEIVTGDASRTSAYADLVPADLVLACGVFGNITNTHNERTIGYCTQLCATGGTVVWTRGRWHRSKSEPDLVPQICDWFSARGFELAWISDPSTDWTVAAYRLAATPAPLEAGARMFTFIARNPAKGPHRPGS
jgi:hypothetical protein